MVQTKVKDCILFDLPKIETSSGNITAINNFEDVPFKIKRVYYLYDIPGGESRGGHAHKALHQLIIAAGGSFDIRLHDGFEERVVHLVRPNQGVYLPPGLWRELENFSGGSICLVLASEEYDEADYIRHFEAFLTYKS
jgi:hypothetical protein